MKANPVVAIVDDDPICRALAQFVLQNGGLRPRAFESGVDFLGWIFKNTCDCILLDISMPGMTGEDLQIKLEEMKIFVPILFLTSEADVSVASALIRRGAVDVVLKPLDPETLIPKIREAIESRLAAKA